MVEVTWLQSAGAVKIVVRGPRLISGGKLVLTAMIAVQSLLESNDNEE